MSEHEKINYVELPSKDLQATKAFYSSVFGWGFIDYGDDYAAIENAGLDGGFYKSDTCSSTENGAALVVLYSKSLEDTQRKILEHGGTIIRPTFSFPGGSRFHFADPTGNELAAWSDNQPWVSCHLPLATL